MKTLMIVVAVMCMYVLPVDASTLTAEQTISLAKSFKNKIDTTGVKCEALSKRGLKDYQIKNMYVSFQYGKERNMSYSLAAIAFKESSAGNPKFMRNPKDPSAGYHGVKLTNVMKTLAMKDNPTNRAMVEDMLINSHGASAWFSMEILGWWLNYHKGDWFKAYRSYNGGFFWKPRKNHQKVLERTWTYAVNIQQTINDIKQCNWK